MSEQRDVTVSVKTIPAGFGKHQGGGHPTQVVIAALPTFDASADRLHHGETGFNAVGAGEGSPQPSMHFEIVPREHLFESFH